MSREQPGKDITNPESMTLHPAQAPAMYNNNSTANAIYGAGKIINKNHVHVDARPPAPAVPYTSNIRVSATIPAAPNVFHGRDELINSMVNLLVPHVTARLAILGAGGMGKTSVALALLNDRRVINDYRGGRIFLSCEALIDADAMVVSLAKILGLPPSSDLLTAVITHLESKTRTILVLDNLETVWLKDGGQITTVDELLGQIAQISTVSLVITCRGTYLPQFVEWSNMDTARLEPFSIEAALHTFQDRARCQLKGNDEKVARELLNSVDRMPLAVSLLGQLSRQGNSVCDLLERWNQKRTSLLRTHGTGRINNVGVSIELSISMLVAADEMREALHLLSLCSMLPDGLSRGVFQKLNSRFKDIGRARDNLIAYSLATLGVNGALGTLSPVRHHVCERHPADANHHAALSSIYFDIAEQLPTDMNECFKERAAVAAPEINNLSSLLLSLVSRPSDQVVDAVLNLTRFAAWSQPNCAVASALLLHLDSHPGWKAHCLQSIGDVHSRNSNYEASIEAFTTASGLFLEIGDKFEAAWTMRRSAEPHRLLGRYDRAKLLLMGAIKIAREIGIVIEEARSWMDLGALMLTIGDFQASIHHLTVAQQTFRACHQKMEIAMCSEHLGSAYLHIGIVDRAAFELEAAYSAFGSLGVHSNLAQTTRRLGWVRRLQDDLTVAEQLLERSTTMEKDLGNRTGLADCALQYGYLRLQQGRLGEAETHFETARRMFSELGMQKDAEICREEMGRLGMSS